MGDIGREVRPVIFEPLEVPEQEPVKVPAEPVEVPA